MKKEAETLEVLPVDPKDKVLAENNITNAVIAEYREKYMTLKINGIQDVKGYQAVDTARKVCMRTRTLATKICKAGREDANRIQKEWLAKEKEVVGAIQEIEGYLEIQMQRVDDEKAQIKADIERKAAERLADRIKALTENGCMFDGTYYSISDLPKLTYQEVNLMSDEKWELHVKAVVAEHTRLEAIAQEEAARTKAEQEEAARIQREEADRLRREREELDKQRLEQEKKAAELKKQQDEITRQNELEAAKKKAAEEERQRIADEERQRAEKQKADELELQRKEALKPDTDKLLELGQNLQNTAFPKVQSEEAKEILLQVQVLLSKTNAYIIKKVEEIS